jgi:hypothetical protein
MKTHIPKFEEFINEAMKFQFADKSFHTIKKGTKLSLSDAAKSEYASTKPHMKKILDDPFTFDSMAGGALRVIGSDRDSYIIDSSRFIVNESELYEMDINDPILMAIRASKEDRKKAVTAQKERMKKRVYGKKREALEDQLWDISRDLKDAYAERRNIYDDMEAEAGEKGNAWSDDDANRYGSRLNLVDDEIEGLLKRRNAIEIKLAY